MNSKNKDDEGTEETMTATSTESQLHQKLVQMTVRLGQIEQVTGPEEVLVNCGDVTAHLLAQGKMVVKGAEFDQITPSDVRPSLQLVPFYDLQPQDRLQLSDLSTASNCVHFGKYLLCQTISFTTQDVAIVSVVTDPKGQHAMSLALFNYSFGQNREFGQKSDDILPPGSYLVVKNPGVKRTTDGMLILLSENPAEVELVSRKRMQTNFPDLRWKGNIAKHTLQFSQKQSFWSKIDGEQAAFEKFAELGHKGLVDGRFSDALRFYDMALDYCVENREEQALINWSKSTALLALGCFNSALRCRAELELEVEPGNEKYNISKIKALLGLGKYEEARSFLEEKLKLDQFSSLSNSEDCKKLLEDVKFLCSRRNVGPTEAQLLCLRLGTLRGEEIIPEFTGPLTLLPAIGGKGRGLAATRDIHPGQLLLATRAFVWSATPSTRAATLLDSLKTKVGNMLTFDPKLKPTFYNLTAGARQNGGHLEADDPRVRHVDMVRIVDTLKANAFGIDGRRAEMGLWILPSLFNHNCSEHNCSWDISGGWMAVRAIAQIEKGAELTLAYQSPIFRAEERAAFFASQGFTCDCSLCQLEAGEPASVCAERATIFDTLGAITLDSTSDEVNSALEGVEKLISLRKDSAALNFPLLSPKVFSLMKILMKNGRHGDALPLLNQMFGVAVSSVCCHSEGIILAIYLSACHVEIGDMASAKVWMTTTKRLMVKFDGYLEAMRCLRDPDLDLQASNNNSNWISLKSELVNAVAMEIYKFLNLL